MPINNTIVKPSLPPTQDFEYLRAKGLSYIQQLSGKLWTDHNLHDPGITILEVLCYALMDLGYRTGFSINDIVREEDGSVTSNAFHPAHKVFTSDPITINDYRRLLVDIPGVRNAWLFTKDEEGKVWGEGIRIFAYCKEGVLLHESQIDSITVPEDRVHVRTNEEVNIKGLYAVKIDLDEHPLFGDLNSSVVSIKFIKDELALSEAIITFPHWSSVDKTGKELISLFNSDKINSIKTELVVPDGAELKVIEKLKRSKWETRWTIKFDTDERVLDNVVIEMTKLPEKFNGLVTGKLLIDSIGGSLDKEAVKRYVQRPKEIFKTFSKVRNKLMQHRNLCEDFLHDIGTVDTEDLRICTDVDVDIHADIESVQAQIFAAIENYLLPPVQFSTLKELLDKGIPVEEIFNGPLLSHGFLTNEAMDEADIKPEYYTCDIISLLMDIPGIKNVRNFQFSVSKSGAFKTITQNWKINVTPNHKLKLDREKSKFMYFKNNLPLLANFQESVNKLRLQQALQTHLKYKDPSNVIKLIPEGKYRHLNKHYTILNEFPRVYGLGEKDLPDEVPVERKARVKQLEGYLTFFDQLLADYFSQLMNIKDMLSWKTNSTQTYFTQYLHQDKDARQLYWDFESEEINGKEVWKNTFLNKQFTKEELISRTSSEQTYLLGKTGLQSLKESANTYMDRKNRLLDHLVSRFAESFNDYAVYMYALPDKAVIDDEQVSHDLIDAKLNFLQNYPELSSQRCKAYDYSLSEEEILGTKDISGFARRMMSLLGMEFKKNLSLKNIDENGNGGFHILEHILLRPVKDKDPLLSVCLDANCDHCGEEDPYSFKVSVILPFWIKKFTNMHFRDYVETLFRSEAPAHVYLKICWIDKKEMEAFEKALSEWMKAKAEYANALPGPGDAIRKKYAEALKGLLESLDGLRTDFPQAKLHDCADKDEANDTRVFLGHTALGTFKEEGDD